MKKTKRFIVVFAVIMLTIACFSFCVNAEKSHELCEKVHLGINDLKSKRLQELCFTPETDDLYSFSVDCYDVSIDNEDEYIPLEYAVDINNTEYKYIGDIRYYELKKDQTYHIELYMDWDFATPYCNFIVDSYKPQDVTNLAVADVTESTVTLVWDAIDYADGYVIYSSDSDLQSLKEVKRLYGANITEVTFKNLDGNAKYMYSLEAFDDIGYGVRYSKSVATVTAFTNPNINLTNSKISKGYFADITHNYINLSSEVYTNFRDNYYSHGHVGEVAHFFDYKNYYTVVSYGEGYVYIDKFDSYGVKLTTLKIKMKYPLFGDMITDDAGNYYIVWGENDTTLDGGKVTVAVSKYSYSGKHLATVKYKTVGGLNSWDTKEPFNFGNCVTVIDSKGVLICSYARVMYNGHQSNDVICVDTSTMKAVEEYNNYVSHSFDQRVLELSNGDICFVNHGDAYPRAFDIEIFGSDRKNYQSFNFYGELGNNHVYSWLGGAVEVGGNIYLVASSAKSMTSNCEKEGYNLFIQLIDDDRTIKGSVLRKGTSCGKKLTDKGVKWLTNYNSKYTVVNPQVVKIDSERFVILFEKLKNDGVATFVQSYYMILSADGDILQKATPMTKTRLTAQEEPIYRDGYIYWTTGKGKTGVIHKLKVGSLVNKLPTPKIISVENVGGGVKVSWYPVNGTDKYRIFRKTPGGDWKKIKDTTYTTYIDKTVENSNEYLYTVRCVSKDGEKYLSSYDKTGKEIYHLKQTSLKAQLKQNDVYLTWSKVSKSTGYVIEYSLNKNFEKSNKTITIKGASEKSYNIENLSKGKTYYFRIKSFKKLSGKIYYSSWSKAVKVKISS